MEEIKERCLHKIMQCSPVTKGVCLNKLIQRYSAASLSYGDFLTLLYYCKNKDLVVELGTNTGSTSELFGLMNIGKIYSIDVFENKDLIENKEQKEFYKNDFNLSKQKDSVTKRLNKYENINLIKGLSYKMAEYFKNLSVTSLFIDADHSFNGIIKDYFAWFPKVKISGYFIFHDMIKITNNLNNSLKEVYKVYEEILLRDIEKGLIKECSKVNIQDNKEYYTSIKVFQKLSKESYND